jgi:hypothetical protein
MKFIASLALACLCCSFEALILLFEQGPVVKGIAVCEFWMKEGKIIEFGFVI